MIKKLWARLFPKQEPVAEVPLIWTSRGNVPIDSLKFEVIWDVQYPHYVKCVQRWRAADGEIVKEGADAYSFAGVTGTGVAGSF